MWYHLRISLKCFTLCTRVLKLLKVWKPHMGTTTVLMPGTNRLELSSVGVWSAIFAEFNFAWQPRIDFGREKKMYWDRFSNSVAFSVRACVLAMDISICVCIYIYVCLYVCLSTCYEGKLRKVKGTHSTTQWICPHSFTRLLWKLESFNSATVLTETPQVSPTHLESRLTSA